MLKSILDRIAASVSMLWMKESISIRWARSSYHLKALGEKGDALKRKYLCFQADLVLKTTANGPAETLWPLAAVWTQSGGSPLSVLQKDIYTSIQ